jgi:hypothetical protein
MSDSVKTEDAEKIEQDELEEKTLKKFERRKYIKFTLIFFAMMAGLYIFSMFGGMLSSPAFTYAEF